MNRHTLKQQRLERRQNRSRAKLHGTANRPRITLQRSLRYMYVQFIDDDQGVTLLAGSDKVLALTGTKKEKAKALGKKLAEQAQAKNIKKIVFDRSGRDYHGRVQALAEGLREGGLEF